MKYDYADDHFKKSTMTFGEHLEELRVCLLRALLGLAVGFVIGIPCAPMVVKFVEMPLRNALEEYYKGKAQETIDLAILPLKPLGLSESDAAHMKNRVEDDGVVPEVWKIDPQQFARQLRQLFPQLAVGAPEATAGEKTLIPVILWRDLADDERLQTQSLSMPEPFLIFIKAALIVGVLVASPWIFWQIWSFVAAGLYPHEKKYVNIFLPFSLGLFLLGAATAFFFVFQPVLKFMLTFNDILGIRTEPRITDWMSFVLVLPLGFGISFQLPLVMLFLERIGIFDVATYLAKWRIAILVVCVVSMLLTPSDPGSMILMAIPLTGLYFFGILLCKYMPKNRNPFGEADEAT